MPVSLSMSRSYSARSVVRPKAGSFMCGRTPRPGWNPIGPTVFPYSLMSNLALPRAAAPAEIPLDIRLQIVSASAVLPEGDGWLHEIKHDGHRLLAIVWGDSLKLLSRNGYDRTALFREPFRDLADAGLPPMVLDGEIAVPDERGVTHIDALSEAIAGRRTEQLAFFAFDLLHFDRHDLRRCAIEDRKALLRDVIGAARCPRIVHVAPLTRNAGRARQLLSPTRFTVSFPR